MGCLQQVPEYNGGMYTVLSSKRNGTKKHHLHLTLWAMAKILGHKLAN